MARKKTRKNTPRPRRRNTSNAALKNAASAVLGGAGGAMVGGMLVRSGVSPTAAAAGVTLGGSVAAVTMKGTGRLAGGGAAAAGAGQLALAWLAAQGDKNQPPKATALAKPRQAAYSADIESAFERAREQLAMEDEAAAFTDVYDDYVEVGA